MRPHLISKVLATFSLLVFSWPALAAVNLNDPIPIGPQVKVGKLANGLTYYIQKNGKPEKKVELRLVVKAGSILEDDDQQGLAHFTEHMGFNGSTHFKRNELVSYLQSIGVKFGADLNAYTSFDQTVYMLPIPTDKKENLETGFLVLEDWAQGVTMGDAEIDQERGIVLEELRLGKGANDRMQKIWLPKLLNDSRYAVRLPIGKENILKTFKYETIKRFYADWYRPDLMAVIVIGDIDPIEAEAMIQSHFAKLKNPAKERPRFIAQIAPRTLSSSVIATDKEATNNVVSINYQIEANKPEMLINDYRQNIVERFAWTMLSLRLQELTQQANPPFAYAKSSADQIFTGFRTTGSFAVVGKNGVNAAIAAVVQENERARQFGFSAAELERTKKNSLRGIESAYKEREKTDSARYAAEYIRNFVQQEAIPGIANEYQYMNELVPNITLEEINRFIQRAIPSNSAKLVYYMGVDKEGTAIPSGADLLKEVEASEKIPVTRKEEKAIAAHLMEQLPKAGSILNEKQNIALGLTELTLSNGIKVFLKPTDFKNDQVLMSGVRLGGQSLFENKDIYSARYADNVAAAMGMKTFSPIDLHKTLAGKTASVGVGFGNYTESISGSANSADIETMFQLLNMKLSNPRKDEALFSAFVGNQQDLTKNAMSNPETVFSDTMLSTLYHDHPRLALTPKPQDFSKIDLDRAMAIYTERFSSAKDMTLIIVGSFDIDKIKPLIATYVASLPTTDIVTNYKDLGIRPIAGVMKTEVRRGAEQKSKVVLNFTGAADYSQDASLHLQALLEVLNIKIIENIREKLSLIYTGNIGGSLNNIPYGNYAIRATLPCAPENVDKVIAALFAEIQTIKDEGPQATDLQKVKKNWITRHQIDLRENGYWINQLYRSALHETNPESILDYEKRVNAITLDDLKIAAKRYLNTDNYMQSVLYPEKTVPM